MPLVFLSYSWGLHQTPEWIHSLISSLPPGVDYYDPKIPLKDQIGRINGLKEESLPEILLDAFSLPKEIMFSPHKDLFDWEGPILQPSVWRDLYFLIRSSVVVVDGNMPNLNDGVVELSLARFLKKPIILVSDRINTSPQVKYISNFITGSDPVNLNSLVALLCRQVPPNT
jgi:hypothetical protein